MSKDDQDKIVVKVEKGFTRMPNILFDALICSNLNSTQKDMCYYLIRRSYGWGRKTAGISLGDFAFVCGTFKPYVSKQLKDLLAKNVIIRVGRKNGQKTVYCFNPDIEEWDKSCIDLDFYRDFIKTGSTKRLYSDITLGLYSDITSGLHSGITSGLHSSITPEPVLALEQPQPQGDLKKGIKKGLKKEKENILLYSQNSQSYKLSKLLLDCILKNLPGFKKPDLLKWSITMERMLKYDKRDPEEVRKVIIFAQDDEFWRANILSAVKLRKQYDMLNARRLSRSIRRVCSREAGDKDEYDFFFNK